MDTLIKGVLLDKCGWEMNDVMLFGFGQGGSLALGMAAGLAADRVVDVSAGEKEGRTFKGVVSIGGGVPMSVVSTRARVKSDTYVLVAQVDREVEDQVKSVFVNTQIVRWKRAGVSMPRDRDEVFPLMKFFADRLKSGWS